MDCVRKFFRIVLRSSSWGREGRWWEGDRESKLWFSYIRAPQVPPGALEVEWSFSIVPVSGKGQRRQASVPYWFGIWGGPLRRHNLGQGSSLHVEQFLGDVASVNTQQQLPLALANMRASVLKEGSGDCTSICSTTPPAQNAEGKQMHFY